MVMAFDDFLELDAEEQLSCLKHPAWKKRCLCRKFGLPWNVRAVLADRDFRHTAYVCAPMIEFTEEDSDE